MTARVTAPLPAFVNPKAGSAEAAEAAIAAAPAFALRAVPPEELADAVRAAAREGAPRVLVAGGDGSLATAATALAGSGTALAILPGGTLNHFAGWLGIPTEPAQALAVAESGEASPVDIGYLNDRAFINTSSIGAYVRFVQLRERMEPRLGYRLASLVAVVRTLAQLRSFTVTLTVNGVERHYRTPVVFVGVGERELRVPILGGRVTPGASALHVMVVRGGRVQRVLATAMLAMTRGIGAVRRSRWIDAFLVESCRVDVSHGRPQVSIDGELVPMATPLDYRLGRGELLVVRASRPGAA